MQESAAKAAASLHHTGKGSLLQEGNVSNSQKRGSKGCSWITQIQLRISCLWGVQPPHNGAPRETGAAGCVGR